MKIIIDDKICLKNGLTPVEVMFGLACRTSKNYNRDLKNMYERGILTLHNGKFTLTDHWSMVLDKILGDSSGGHKKTDEELLALAMKVQECFPKQRMLDRFGSPTPYYYRCNRTEIKGSLKRFFENSAYNNASDDEIIDATKRYVASFNGDYNGKMRLAKYFIWKNDVKPSGDGTGHVEIKSDLETFLENKGESEEEVEINTGEWLTTSRN